MTDDSRAGGDPRRLPSLATLLAAQVRYQFRLLLATPGALVIGVGLPVILLVASHIRHGDTITAAPQVAGYAVLGLTMIAWNTHGIRLIAAREQGILRRWRAAPLPPWCYFTGRIAAASLFATMAAAVTLLAATAFYGVPIDGGAAGGMVAVLLLGALAWAAASTAMSSVIPSMAAAQPSFVLIYFPVILISGGLGSVSSEPHWLATFASYLPAEPVRDAVSRAILHDSAFSARDLLVLAAWAAGCLCIAAARFRWEPYRPAQRRPARQAQPARSAGAA
jgi:ABC-2 type transport system permease protein